MTDNLGVAQIEAAKDITLALISKGAIIQGDQAPEVIGERGGTLYATIFDAVRSPDKYQKK